MIRVLHLTWGLEVGGKEQFLLRLAQGLPRDRFETHVWCLRRKGPVHDQVKAIGCHVAFIGKLPGLDVCAMARLAADIRRLRPDVIHVHELTSTILALANPFRCAAGCPVLATLHGGHRGLPWLKRALNDVLLRRAWAVVAVSREMAERTQARLALHTRVRFIPYGVDARRPPNVGALRGQVRRTLGLTDQHRVAVMVARLTRPKRPDLLVRAARDVCARMANARFVLVGHGDLRASLERQVHAWGLTKRVVFTGERGDVPALLACADVGVLATDREGLPNAVLEYMVAGLPVIASAVSGLPEMVRDGTTGLLVAPGDADALAARLVTLLGDRELARRMGHAGREAVTRDYSYEAMCRRYARLYEEAAGRLPRDAA